MASQLEGALGSEGPMVSGRALALGLAALTVSELVQARELETALQPEVGLGLACPMA